MLEIKEISNFFQSLSSFALPSIGSFSLAAVLFYRKIGHSIEYHFEVNDSEIFYPRIKNIKLLNKKDKPESIFAIYIMIYDTLYPIFSNKNPIIIKSYESSVIEIDRITTFKIDGLDVEAKIFEKNKDSIGVYVSLDRKFHRCREIKRGDANVFSSNRNIKLADPSAIYHRGYIVPLGAIYWCGYFDIDSGVKKHFFIFNSGHFTINEKEYQFDMDKNKDVGDEIKILEEFLLKIEILTSVKVESVV